MDTENKENDMNNKAEHFTKFTFYSQIFTLKLFSVRMLRVCSSITSAGFNQSPPPPPIESAMVRIEQKMVFLSRLRILH